MSENRESERTGIVFVISGPSGSGKGTVVDLLRTLCPDMGLSVSATTREKRDYEQEGVNYYFKTREQFEKMIAGGELLEYAEYNGNLYGTPKSELERVTGEGHDLILEIEVKGAAQVKELLGKRAVCVMLIAPSGEEQERRLRGRGSDTEEEIAARVRRAREEIREAPRYDYVVVNETGKVQQCAETILGIMQSEHLRSDRMMSYIRDYFEDDEL